MDTVALDLFEHQHGGRERRAYEKYLLQVQTFLSEVESRSDFVLLSARLFPEEDSTLWWQEAEACATARLDLDRRLFPEVPFERIVIVAAVGTLVHLWFQAVAINQGGEVLLQEVCEAIDHGTAFLMKSLN